MTGGAAVPASEADEALLATFPTVRVDHDNKHYYRGLLNHQLVIDRCNSCGYWYVPPSYLCPRCWSEDTDPQPVRGTGTVDLVTLLHQGPPAPGVDYSTPYPLVGVELDEQPGLRVSSTIVNSKPDDVHRGLRVRLHWIERAGAPYPAWQPAESTDEQTS